MCGKSELWTSCCTLTPESFKNIQISLHEITQMGLEPHFEILLKSSSSLDTSRTSQDMDGALHTDFANFYTI